MQRQYPSVIQFTPEGHVTFENVKFVSDIAPTEGRDVVSKMYGDGEIKTTKRHMDDVVLEVEKKRKIDIKNTSGGMQILYSKMNTGSTEILNQIKDVVKISGDQNKQALQKHDKKY